MWGDTQCQYSSSSGFAHLNALATLECENDDSAEHVSEQLIRWARVVTKSSQRSKNRKVLRNVKSQLSSTEDLAAIKALPTDFAGRARIAKNHRTDRFSNLASNVR